MSGGAKGSVAEGREENDVKLDLEYGEERGDREKSTAGRRRGREESRGIGEVDEMERDVLGNVSGSRERRTIGRKDVMGGKRCQEEREGEGMGENMAMGRGAKHWVKGLEWEDVRRKERVWEEGEYKIV